jgi:predicted enzyme related to lactoylglutathione lyase
MCCPGGGAAFRWVDASGQPMAGTTIWSIGGQTEEGNAALPVPAPFVINYRVADLAALVQTLRDEGCQVLEQTESSEHGHFGWVIDPEGNKVELWQPPPGQ